MVTDHTKGALAGSWILTAGLVGVLGNVTSLGAGALILAIGLLPPLIFILRGTAVAGALVRNSRGPLG